MGGRRPAGAIKVPPARPHVARAVPMFVIVDACRRRKPVQGFLDTVGIGVKSAPENALIMIRLGQIFHIYS